MMKKGGWIKKKNNNNTDDEEDQGEVAVDGKDAEEENKQKRKKVWSNSVRSSRFFKKSHEMDFLISYTNLIFYKLFTWNNDLASFSTNLFIG